MQRLRQARAWVPALVAALLIWLAVLDVGARFGLLRGGARWPLLLLAGIVGYRGLRSLLGGRRGGRPARFAGLILALILACFALNGLLFEMRAGKLIEEWRAGEQERLQARADLLQSEFRVLMTRLEAPILRARALATRNPMSGGPRSPGRAFQIVDLISSRESADPDRIGLALYRSTGPALAWSGRSEPLPRELVNLDVLPGETRWVPVQADGLSRIVALARPWREPFALLAVEMVVRSIYDGAIHSGLFAPDTFRPETDRVNFADFRRPPFDLAELFEMGGDVFQVSGRGTPSVHAALRSPDGTLLGHATLSGRSLAATMGGLELTHRSVARALVAIAGLLLVGLALLPRPSAVAYSPASEVLKQSGRILFVWSYRALLLLYPPEAESLGRALTDPAVFAMRGVGGLLATPLDFLLTGLATLATGLLISLAVTRILLAHPVYRRRVATICLAGSLLIAFVLGTYLPSAVAGVVKNANSDLLTVAPFDPQLPRLVLQTSAAFLLAGIVIVLITLGWAALWISPARVGGSPPGPPLPTDSTLKWLALLVVPAVVASCFLLELTWQPAATSVLRRLIEDHLATIVRAMPTLRRVDLRGALDAVKEHAALADRVVATPPEGDPALSWELWTSGPLRARGAAASLTVWDAEGRRLSRFSRNFPPILDLRASEKEDIHEETIEEFVTGPYDRQVRALHAHKDLERDGIYIGTVTIHLRNDFGDLAPLMPPGLIQRALGEARPVSPLLPSWSPYVGLAVYTAGGVPLQSEPWDPPPAPAPSDRRRILSDFREKLWQTREEESYRVHDHFFSSAGRLVALSFPEPGPTGRLARALRLSGQSALILLVLLAPLGIAAALRLGWRPSPSRLVLSLTRTHYRRLVTTFLVAALAPLVLLAFALTNFVARESEGDLIELGRTVLEAASRRVEGVAILQGEEGPPDDASLFGLSEKAGEALSLFIGGDLSAASDREIYEIGALPRRLGGEVQRQIILEGRRIVPGTLTIKGRTYPTVNGVVSLGIYGQGILQIMLGAETPEIARRTQAIFDTLLITTASVIFVMGILAYALARRIAAPIRGLSEAAARIATGDLDAEVTFSPRDETGDLVASFNAMSRALRRQREALEQRGNYIEKILLNATTGVLSVDLEGRIVTFNPAAVAILGIPHLRAGRDLKEILSASPDFETLADALEKALASPGKPREAEISVGPAEELRHSRARLVPFTEGSGLLLFLDDVTETIRSNRLAAWAEMARRIAHEIKNPLTPIQLSVDHIRRVHADCSEHFSEILGECLRTINEQVSNLRSISAQFSIYARHPEIRKEPTPMREFLAGVIRPYRSAPPQNVSVECDLVGDLPVLEIDRTLFSQALVNLIENAVQAMPEGGRLMMRASPERRDGDRKLQVVISDTGVGMDREALSRAFEPYFSTKGTGTGLGMAIARKAIEEHQGRLELTSAPRKGTTAKIVIPIPPAPSGNV